ncbi:MAG: hypothetical protein PHR00_01705 [Patescibacteria group bacterium]|nr:hypothetical protein [Patescibacteria group bacterium]
MYKLLCTHKKNPIKRRIYIVGFTLLGWLLAFSIYSFGEYLWLNALVDNFDKYSHGLSWDQWWFIHYLILLVFSFGGIIYGFWQGHYWWNKVYDCSGNIKK